MNKRCSLHFTKCMDPRYACLDNAEVRLKQPERINDVKYRPLLHESAFNLVVFVPPPVGLAF